MNVKGRESLHAMCSAETRGSGEGSTHANGHVSLVDAHVHIHDAHPQTAVLDCACKNFLLAARSISAGDSFTGVLLLTETARASVFQRMWQSADTSRQTGTPEAGWWFRHTDEPCSLWAHRGPDMRLLIVAGRQIVTAERLEVLAIGTSRFFPDGKPTDEVVRAVTASGALAVIPWGFGKWRGRRGRILSDLMKQFTGSDFFLGDNGGRPRLLPDPAQFTEARSRGFGILPGSDPLPFRAEFRRAGSFGFALPGVLSEEMPSTDLKRLILGGTRPIEPFGQLEGSVRFIRNQISMQIHKHVSQAIGKRGKRTCALS